MDQTNSCSELFITSESIKSNSPSSAWRSILLPLTSVSRIDEEWGKRLDNDLRLAWLDSSFCQGYMDFGQYLEERFSSARAFESSSDQGVARSQLLLEGFEVPADHPPRSEIPKSEVVNSIRTPYCTVSPLETVAILQPEIGRDQEDPFATKQASFSTDNKQPSLNAWNSQQNVIPACGGGDILEGCNDVTGTEVSNARSSPASPDDAAEHGRQLKQGLELGLSPRSEAVPNSHSKVSSATLRSSSSPVEGPYQYGAAQRAEEVMDPSLCHLPSGNEDADYILKSVQSSALLTDSLVSASEPGHTEEDSHEEQVLGPISDYGSDCEDEMVPVRMEGECALYGRNLGDADQDIDACEPSRREEDRKSSLDPKFPEPTSIQGQGGIARLMSWAEEMEDEDRKIGAKGIQGINWADEVDEVEEEERAATARLEQDQAARGQEGEGEKTGWNVYQDRRPNSTQRSQPKRLVQPKKASGVDGKIADFDWKANSTSARTNLAAFSNQPFPNGRKNEPATGSFSRSKGPHGSGRGYSARAQPSSQNTMTNNVSANRWHAFHETDRRPRGISKYEKYDWKTGNFRSLASTSFTTSGSSKISYATVAAPTSYCTVPAGTAVERKDPESAGWTTVTGKKGGRR